MATLLQNKVQGLQAYFQEKHSDNLKLGHPLCSQRRLSMSKIEFRVFQDHVIVMFSTTRVWTSNITLRMG